VPTIEKGHTRFIDNGDILVQSDGFDCQNAKKHFDTGRKYEKRTVEKVTKRSLMIHASEYSGWNLDWN
jgi:hypothetical protein